MGKFSKNERFAWPPPVPEISASQIPRTAGKYRKVIEKVFPKSEEPVLLKRKTLSSPLVTSLVCPSLPEEPPPGIQ